MKISRLAVLALVTLASFVATAQTFGFATTGGGLYCNYEQLSYYGGGLWAGSDNLSACGVSTYAEIVGFTVTVPNQGSGAHGAGVVYGDAIFTALVPGDAGNEYAVFTKLKCNKKDKSGHYLGANGWIGIAGITGYFAGVANGPLSCDIPGRNGIEPTLGISAGAAIQDSKRNRTSQ